MGIGYRYFGFGAVIDSEKTERLVRPLPRWRLMMLIGPPVYELELGAGQIRAIMTRADIYFTEKRTKELCEPLEKGRRWIISLEKRLCP